LAAFRGDLERISINWNHLSTEDAASFVAAFYTAPTCERLSRGQKTLFGTAIK
jgi:hypothetical protein